MSRWHATTRNGFAKYASNSTRVSASSDDSGVLVTAYRPDGSDSTSVIVINTGKDEINLTISVPGATSASGVTTSAGQNMASIVCETLGSNIIVNVAPQSITSLSVE